MRKLPVPNIDFSTLLNTCIAGVGRVAMGQKYRDNFLSCADIEEDFTEKANTEELFTLPRTNAGRGDDPVVHGVLRKSELTKLYTNYLVPKEKPARRIYEQLKVTTNGKCPFCGDIGHVFTLDHFLPKANFPLYSVLPANLVPCCRDCNSDKLNSFSETREEQTLHPYFDSDQYFVQKWVNARVIPSSPPILEFFPDPPLVWHEHEKQRVKAHFEEYSLAARFGVEAGADLPETIHTRKTSLSAFSPDEFSEYLREKSDNIGLPINNWRRVMYAALANDKWFCAEVF